MKCKIMRSIWEFLGIFGNFRDDVRQCECLSTCGEVCVTDDGSGCLGWKEIEFVFG